MATSGATVTGGVQSPGYYLVALDNHNAGIVKVAAGRQPTAVGGHKVTALSFLGTTPHDVYANWTTAVRNIGAFGLYELVPPNQSGQQLAGDPDINTLLSSAERRGAGILTKTPNEASWDPTFTYLAAGAGAVVAGTVAAAATAAGADAAGTAAGADAAGTAAGDTATAATAGGTGGTAAKLLGDGLNAAKTVAGALSVGALFTNIGLWKGIGMVLGGAVLVLIGLFQLAGVEPGGVARKVIT